MVTSVRLRVGEAAGPEVLFEDPAPPGQADLVAWVERLEPLSRGAFVDALVKGGCPKGPVAGRSAAGVPAAVEADLATLSPVAQVAALRGLHEAIRREGESPELLGALVRGYAQLGVLTEYQWCAAHDAYKARALLYAQRLMAIDPKSPSGPWHRAFAAALVGLHQAALDDLAEGDRRAGADAKGRPDWAGLIAAYCRHDPAGLEVGAGDRRAPLAALLGFLEIEHSGATVQILEAGAAALRGQPECFRILDVLCAVGGVAANNWAAQFGPAVMAQALPARLQKVPGLPAEVKAALDGGDEAATVRALVAAGAPGADRGEPSLAALGRIIREARFVVVWRQLRWMRDMLGVPAGDALGEIRPLVADHPYRNYLETFALDPARQRPASGALLKAIEVRDAEDNEKVMFMDLIPLDGIKANVSLVAMSGHREATVRDLARLCKAPDFEFWASTLDLLLKVSPGFPEAVAATIQFKWKDAEAKAKAWEAEHARHAVVLGVLARKYLELDRPDDARRCLKAYLALSPDRWAYERLAGLYLAQGDKAAWKATLEEALTKPDPNLDHMVIRSKLALDLMKQKKWDEARPYAEAAAESYSQRGMQLGALCAEGRKDWDGAETWIRRIAERYPDSGWQSWLLWCARTGHGDLPAAEKAAARAAGALAGRAQPNDLGHIGFFKTWIGQPREAFAAHERSFDATHELLYGLSLVALAAELKDPALRGATLARVMASANAPAPPPRPGASVRPPLTSLLEQFKAWAGGALPDFKALDRELGALTPAERANRECAIGRFLAAVDRPDDAARYLERAAKAPETSPWLRVLAIRALRTRGVALNDDDIAPPLNLTFPTMDRR